MSDGMKGQFVWHELMTTDAKAAVGFYSKVAKLKTQPAPFEKSYMMLVGGGRPMGGLMVLAGDATATGTPPSWLTYIGTGDVDETARKAESLGGKIIKSPGPVPDGGRFAILKDPQGAVFAIYSASAAQSGNALPTDVPLGHSSWHELATTDHAAAFSFYQQLFGWQTTSSMDMGGQGVYRMFGPSGAKDPFGGMYSKAAGSPGGPNWLPYIKVVDARPATKTAQSSGAQILNGPMQVPGGGWISMGIDPQGAMFAVHSAAPAAATKPTAATKKKAAPAKKRAAAKKATGAKKKVVTKKKAAPRRAKRKAGSKK
jgi:predicted enzyme related to lactoylglutathione lyase